MKTNVDNEDIVTNVCIICYKNVELKCRCTTCQTYTCSTCWFSMCKTLCPICQRKELNKKLKCANCCKGYLVKDVTICWICDNVVCDGCLTRKIHGCSNLISPNEHILTSVDEMLDRFKTFSSNKNKFSFLGKLETPLGTLRAYNDFDCSGSLLMIVWENGDRIKKEEFEETCLLYNMVVLSLKHVSKGIKCFDIMNEESFAKEVQKFVSLFYVLK